jgi:hypothetical protein
MMPPPGMTVGGAGGTSAGGAGGAGGMSAPATDRPSACGGTTPAVRLQRLTMRQIADSFRHFGIDPASLGPTISAVREPLLQPLDAPFKLEELEHIDRLAGSLPAQMRVEAKFAKRLGDCVAGAADAQAACVARVWSSAALELWGLESADGGAALASTYLDLVKTGGEAVARATVFRALATDPEFLYLQRVPPGTTPRQMALFRRWVSYRLTHSPQPVRVEAVGKPADAFIDALFARGEFTLRVAEFYENFLDLDDARSMVKDNRVYPFLTLQYANGLLTSFRNHVRAIVGRPQAGFLAPLFDPVTFDPASAHHMRYGPKEGSSAYGARAQERLGLFAHPASLASLSVSNDTAPLHNGLLFLDKVLCQLPPPPPFPPDTVPFEEDPKKSRRANFEARTAGPTCSGCHEILNPVSFAFDLYDATGQLRPDSDLPKYNADGRFKLESGKMVTFANAMEMVSKLAGEEQVLTCHVVHWAEHLDGAALDQAGRCRLKPVLELAKRGATFREVLKALLLRDELN